jgi:stearoyl-CoA desaturase (delta-9 desaturase)
MYAIVSGGYFCLMGSPIVWVGVHRLHHQKSDMPGDPHSPRDGFKHALYEWMFNMSSVQSDEELQRAAGDLMQDPLFRSLGDEHKPMQAQLCLGLNIVFRLIMFAFFGWVAVLANILATFIVFWSTQLVNAVCHLPTAGYRLFDTKEDSRNVWWVAVLALGEGWHNNHHAVPKSARHGMAPWEFDVTYFAIVILEKLGLGTKVILPPAERLPKKWEKLADNKAAIAAEPAKISMPLPVDPEAIAAQVAEVVEAVVPPSPLSSRQ